jgi:alpha-ketoglutarate-dependent taurine dioxygenase
MTTAAIVDFVPCGSIDRKIEIGYLSDRADRPLVISPSGSECDLVAWAGSNRERIDILLMEHRALLFRGFQVATTKDLHTFVVATSSGPLLEYKDRSTPRYEVGNGVYVSTIYPNDQHIRLHNEGTYWKTWPRKIYFCCLQPAAEGGETPIGDVRRIYQKIDPEVRKEFEAKQVMYVRNYNPGIGLPWKEVFQTQDRSAVQQYAEQNSIHIEWLRDGNLRTRQIRPAVRNHPVTDEQVWFNHAVFFHVTSLAPEVRDVLLSSYGEEGLPYNTYFGDGTPINESAVEHIRQCYQAEESAFEWRQGDILMLDNMSMAHGRHPYTGQRNVIVAMTEAQSA